MLYNEFLLLVETIMKDLNQVSILDATLEKESVDSLVVLNEEERKISKEDLKTYGLKISDVKDVMEVKSRFNDVSTLSVAEYGKDISSESNKCTSELLSLVRNNELDETGTKLNQVLSVAQTINSSNLISSPSGLSKLPLIGALFKSAKGAKQKFEMRFADTNSQIDGLVKEIEVNQGGLKQRVDMLDKMFNAVDEDRRTLGVYIVAGKTRYTELQEEIKELTAKDPLKEDMSVSQRIYDLNHICNNLDKRLSDLHLLQQSAIQTMPMIRLIQSNNTMLIDKFYSIKTITIPAWKNQISLALSLNEQENSVKLATAIDNTTNELLKRNAELLHTNSVAVAKANQRSVIDVATLEHVQNTLIKTVNEVINIQKQGVQAREDSTKRLKALQDNYNKAIVSDSVRIAYKNNS